MPHSDLDYEELTRILTDNFSVLANEVQVANHVLPHYHLACTDLEASFSPIGTSSFKTN
jgi:hypothetical protein